MGRLPKPPGAAGPVNVLASLYMVSSSEGWAVGDVGTILHYSVPSTPLAPAVVTGAASDVTSTSAVLHGTVNPNGSPTTWDFRDPHGTPAHCPGLPASPPYSLPYLDSVAHDVSCPVTV